MCVYAGVYAGVTSRKGDIPEKSIDRAMKEFLLLSTNMNTKMCMRGTMSRGAKREGFVRAQPTLGVQTNLLPNELSRSRVFPLPTR